LKMAESIRRGIYDNQQTYYSLLRGYRSISHSSFTCNGFDFKLLSGGRAIEKSGNNRTIRLPTRSRNGIFPDEPWLSNVIVIGLYAYCYNGRFWSLDLFSRIWEEVNLRPTVDVGNASEMHGTLLTVVDESAGIFQFTQIRTNNLLFIADYRLDTIWDNILADISSLTVTHRPSRSQFSEGRNRLTQADKEIEEKKERIRKLREEDCKNDSLSTNYSRRCGICFIDNPSRRAVFTSCGHFSCFACAEELSNSEGRLDCPFCRKRTKFVKLFEEETEDRQRSARMRKSNR
ncbi:hypothetical protein PFISCL1PPCAC_9465, partial [Pristionchus fissidentatus]